MIHIEIILNSFSSKLIYVQIVDQLEQQVLSGKVKEHEALTSIRSLANSLKVSVFTTKKFMKNWKKRN